MQRIRQGLMVLSLLLAISAVMLLPLGEYLALATARADELGAAAPVVIALAYIPATALFIPGTALTLGAGALLGTVTGTLAVSVGSTLGSTLTFLIGRHAARDWVTHRVQGNARFAALDRAVALDGFRIVLLSRLSPVFPYNMLGYMYGITGVSTRDYVLASWLGMLPGTLAFVYLGSIAGEAARAVSTPAAGADDITRWAMLAVGVAATIAVSAVITRIARRALADSVPDDLTMASSTADARLAGTAPGDAAH